MNIETECTPWYDTAQVARAASHMEVLARVTALMHDDPMASSLNKHNFASSLICVS